MPNSIGRLIQFLSSVRSSGHILWKVLVLNSWNQASRLGQSIFIFPFLSLHLSISSRLNSSTMPACPCVCVTCAILVCFFVSVFLISSFLHLCLCHVCSILPVLTFLPAQWKEDDGRARQDYLGEEKLPSCPLFWGVKSPRMGMWSQILGSGEVSGKTPAIFAVTEDSTDICVFVYTGLYLSHQKILIFIELTVWGRWRWNNQKHGCLKYSGVNRPIWDEQPIIGTKIANFCSLQKLNTRLGADPLSFWSLSWQLFSASRRHHSSV